MRRLSELTRQETVEAMGRLASIVALGCERLGIANPGFVLVVSDPRNPHDVVDGSGLPDTIQLVANMTHETAMDVLRVTIDRYDQEQADERDRVRRN